jgi:hypothetical protein
MTSQNACIVLSFRPIDLLANQSTFRLEPATAQHTWHVMPNFHPTPAPFLLQMAATAWASLSQSQQT